MLGLVRTHVVNKLQGTYGIELIDWKLHLYHTLEEHTVRTPS